MENDTWSLRNISTGEILSISKSVFRIGRNINADLTSLTSSLSRNHAIISILIDGLLYVQDNNSCNGTFVNNQKIKPMEMILLNEGYTVGFGCCEDLYKDRSIETPSLIFTVLKKHTDLLGNNQIVEEQVQTVKGTFSSNADCIIISDEEDDADLFSNSQIYKISEKIKSEQKSNHESEDPYYNIKHELEDLDFCDNNQYVVDLTEEQNCFEKTCDLLEILESPVQKSTNTVLNEESNQSANQKYKIPPIIEPHFDEKKLKKDNDSPKSESNKSKKQGDGVGNIKSKNTTKRKSTVSSPLVKKKSKNSNLLETKYDKKSIAKEFNKRSKNKSPTYKTKCSEDKTAILEERKKKLKEIANTNENLHNVKEKIVKHRAKVKNSNSRGTFLLEGSSDTQKNDIVSIPSTSKNINTKIIKKQSESLKIQDTTITSNFSPINDAERSVNLSKPTTQISNDCQDPDSTFNENRSGLIWKTTSNFFSLTKTAPKNITIDDEICKIVHWCVKWLMEQNSTDRSPPVNGEMQLKHMPLYFNSFSEYIDTVTALTMLELWQYIYQTLYSKDEERSPIKISLNHKRIVGKLTYLDCECYLSEENVKNNTVPRTDDFALIELKLKDSANSYMYTGFGYIKYCKRKYVQENSRIDNQIAGLSSEIPNINLTFSIMTRNLANKEIMGKQIMMKVIANIGSYLKLLKSVKYLETSLIAKNILHPKIDDFSVPSQDQRLIVEVNLNKEQKQIVLEACSLCLGNIPRLYLIKGPPGTGKSTVIVNIVLQILLSSTKDNTNESPLILLTAPSNAAVDGLTLKLAETRQKLPEAQRKHIKMVRLGPESSISKNVEKFKLSSLARKHILMDRRLTSSEKYKDVLNKGLDTDCFLRNHFGNKTYYYEMKCAEDVLLFGSNIICTTLNSCVGPKIMEGKRRDKLKFTCCIVDEATQCTEPESLLPVQLGIDKIILVGDPKQLPAVVCNKEAQQLGYGRSLFARIDENFLNNTNSPIRMLCEQYRMKPEICEYPNKTFYNGKLKSLPMHVNRIIPEIKPYLLFNILSSENEDESLYRNSQEVGLIYNLLGTLRACIQINCKYSIGIITPYRAQKDLLLKQISGVKFNANVSITVNTVDSFQGMENDVVIISSVRYTPNYFLQNEQRLNVALTRARQALYIIGNYSLFKHCQPLYDLREDAKKRRLCIDIKEFTKNIDFTKFILK